MNQSAELLTPSQRVELLQLIAIAAVDLPITDIGLSRYSGSDPRARAKLVTGLHVTFANGYTLSVQWHSGAYSNIGRGHAMESEGPTFECAAWGPDDKWYRLGDHDDVAGYRNAAEVVAIARDISALGGAL